MTFQVVCPICNGSGWVAEHTYNDKQPSTQHMVKCKRCNGKGTVAG